MKKTLQWQINNRVETDLVISLNDRKTMEQLNWEGDGEFSFNGEMYDVIEKTTTNNKIVIRCISDKKETALLKQIADNWRENRKSNNIVNEFFQLLQTLFHYSEPDKRFQNELCKHSFHSLFVKLPFQAKKTSTPPPRV